MLVWNSAAAARRESGNIDDAKDRKSLPFKASFFRGPGGGFGESDGNREAMGSSSQL